MATSNSGAGDLGDSSNASTELMDTDPSSDNSPEDVQSKVDQTVEEVEPKPKQEPTLTDHLNKKLLSSFLSRLDSGAMNFPPQTNTQDKCEEDDFNDS